MIFPANGGSLSELELPVESCIYESNPKVSLNYYLLAFTREKKGRLNKK